MIIQSNNRNDRIIMKMKMTTMMIKILMKIMMMIILMVKINEIIWNISNGTIMIKKNVNLIMDILVLPLLSLLYNDVMITIW